MDEHDLRHRLEDLGFEIVSTLPEETCEHGHLNRPELAFADASELRLFLEAVRIASGRPIIEYLDSGQWELKAIAYDDPTTIRIDYWLLIPTDHIEWIIQALALRWPVEA